METVVTKIAHNAKRSSNKGIKSYTSNTARRIFEIKSTHALEFALSSLVVRGFEAKPGNQVSEVDTFGLYYLKYIRWQTFFQGPTHVTV